MFFNFFSSFKYILFIECCIFDIFFNLGFVIIPAFSLKDVINMYNIDVPGRGPEKSRELD